MNTDINIYARLRERELSEEGVFIAEGRFLVKRAITSSMKLLSVLCLPSLKDEFSRLMNLRPREERVPVLTAPKREMEAICGFPFHRGVLAAGLRGECCSGPERFESSSRLLLCSNVADPFNLGGLFRSAAALGWDGIILTDRCADPMSRGALRASMGAAFTLPFHIHTEGVQLCERLKKMGFLLTGAVIPGENTIDILDWKNSGRQILLLGNEGDGLTPEIISRCDNLVSISMTVQVDSINVGVAGGILMHYLSHSGSASVNKLPFEERN